MGDQPGSSGAAISLPQGGGAIRGIGETFQADSFSGTGSLTVPIPVSPGRDGFSPEPALQYTAGSGNGPFGLGWQLALPRVTRKTEKGLPSYGPDDRFVLSGAEDLVRTLVEAPNADSSAGTRWIPEPPVLRGDYRATRYRPRTEGLFSRIERWEKQVGPGAGDVHWRATTKDNLTSVYGLTPAARTADPEDARRIYEWLLEETFDARGNHIRYEYAAEAPSLSVPGPQEQGRSYASRRYLRRVLYGNTPADLATSEQLGPTREGRHYVFEVLFDYGDLPDDLAHAYSPAPLTGAAPNSPELLPAGTPVRDDPFSSYRPGFELRTLRRCRRVLMVHHFAELQATGKPTATVVKSTTFDYEVDPTSRLSFLSGATVHGHRWDASLGAYVSASMPSLTFNYARFQPQSQRFQSLEAAGGALPPTPLSDPNTVLVDLFGRGLPDILQTDVTGFRYWRNLGSGRLDHPRTLPIAPVAGGIVTLDRPGVSLTDMDGNGMPELLVLDGPLQGYFETEAEGTWQTFRTIPAMPTLNLTDPQVQLVDLTGDGLSDILMMREHDHLWYRCLGAEGFDGPRFAPRHDDLNGVHSSDAAGRLRLADMSGDGLSDLVSLHDGLIEYWPNLGYGRFGQRVTMHGAPRLEPNYDPARLFLADVDGSGAADLVYVDFNRVSLWLNRSGNGWSEAQVIPGTPATTNAAALTLADVYGNGTAALVWSYDLGLQPGSNYRVLDFVNGDKPYVLRGMDNHLGATTRVAYAPSTRFRLEDEMQGVPWATPLPFPVQVVERVEVVDHISRTKHVARYRYHHGYFDGRDREFRGFGQVDRIDTEAFEDFARGEPLGSGRALHNATLAYHAPPVMTRTWYHTGAYLQQRGLSDRYRRDFWEGDPLAFARAPHAVPATPDAYRTLSGSPLREEVFGLDGSPVEELPYTVTEHRHRVRLVQPKGDSPHAVYLSTPAETLTYQYERHPDDPRIRHDLILKVDAFGNVTDSVTVTYPRRRPAAPFRDDSGHEILDGTGDPVAPYPEQRTLHAVYSHARFINEVDDPDVYLVGLPYEQRAFEIHGPAWTWPSPGQAPTSPLQALGADVFLALDDPDAYAPFHVDPPAAAPAPQKRLLAWSRTYFRADSAAADLDAAGAGSGRLPLSEVAALALPYETRQLALTDDLISVVYGSDAGGSVRVSSAMLGDSASGAYVREPGLDDLWWIPSDRTAFDPARFYRPVTTRDAFGAESRLLYDRYGLLPVAVQDALGNTIRAANDYRVLQPILVRDPNHNYTEVAFDALGMVVAAALMGKAGDPTAENDDLTALPNDLDFATLRGRSQADHLDGIAPDPAEQQRRAYLSDPLGAVDPATGSLIARSLIGSAGTRIVYDLSGFDRDEQPATVATLSREIHSAEAGGHASPIRHSFVYVDGMGRESQTKAEAEPGPLIEGGPDVTPRWVGNGWTIYNNKGLPVQQYEPFFSGTHAFEFDREVGVSPTLLYDPLGRVVCTLHPNHSYEKVVFDPWHVERWDANDTLLLSPDTDPDVGPLAVNLNATTHSPTWLQQRVGGSLGPAERAAAQKAAAHANTPATVHLDGLGRTFRSIADSGDAGLVTTHFVLDVHGNPRSVTDPRGLEAFSYTYDLAGRRLSVAGQDAGPRLSLPDAGGQPLVAWDAVGRRTQTAYDALRRPVALHVTESGATRRVLQTLYGEAAPGAADHNLRTKVVEERDEAGTHRIDGYDLHGKPRVKRRTLTADHRASVDWDTPPLLESTSYTATTEYDALGRVRRNVAPDGSVYRPTYNEAGLLERLEVRLWDHGNDRPDTQASVFVAGVTYNAKGQRLRIAYGNGVETTYAYETDTFRLTHLVSRKQDGTLLQDLHTTYDPVGNVTQIQDAAFHAVFNHNTRVDATSRYTYDPLYRLIEAQGREHETMGACHDRQGAAKQTQFILLTPQPTQNGQALANYTQTYSYDAAGNLTEIRHANTRHQGWTRTQAYAADSNRLLRSEAGCAAEARDIPHDANGNITTLPHLTQLHWDHAGRLRQVETAVQTNATNDRAFYSYDAGGQRVRKVIERGGARSEERIYLGGFEIYREFDANGLKIERRTLHVMDDQQRIALVETRTDAGATGEPRRTRYQLADHLGSSLLEVDGTQAAHEISYEAYYPYGGTAYLAGKDEVEVKRKRYRYSGKERDDETGLYYYGARYYAPWLGRWMSCDPLGPKDHHNLYLFVRAGPLSHADPAGLISTTTTQITADHKLIGAPPSEIVEFVANTQEGYRQYYETLQKQGLTRSEIGTIVAERLQGDFARHFGEGVAEVKYSQIGSGHVIDISIDKYDLDIELKLSKGAVRRGQKQVFVDKAIRNNRTLAFVSAEHMEIYHFGKQSKSKLTQLRRAGARLAAEITSVPIRLSGAGTKAASALAGVPPRAAAQIAGSLAKGPVLDIVLSPLADTPMRDGGLTPDFFDPHFNDRLAQEDDYFGKLAAYKMGLVDEEPVPPWTPPDEMNDLGKAFLALREVDETYGIGETAMTWWGDRAADAYDSYLEWRDERTRSAK